MTLKELLEKIKEIAIEEWDKLLPELRSVVIPVAVNIVEGLKVLVNADSPDIIGSILGKAGQHAEDVVRTVLPKVLLDLEIAKDCADQPTPEQVIACAVAHLKLSDNVQRNLLYHNIAVMIGVQLSDGKLSLGEGIKDIQYYYENKDNPSLQPLQEPVPSQPEQPAAPEQSTAQDVNPSQQG